MELKKILVTKNMTALTANAFYQLETNTANGVLNRITAGIYSPESATGQEEYIGNISYENDTLSCCFPSIKNVSLYFADFEEFMQEVKKSPEQETTE